MIMPTFTSMDDLEAQMMKYVEKATQEVVDTAYEDGLNNQSIYFYGSKEPDHYDRTGKFGRSIRKTDPVTSGNAVEGKVYRDTDYTYPQMFPSNRDGNYTTSYHGVVPAEDVHNWAEKQLNGILGNPNSWQRTLESIQKDMDVIFGSYFKKA